MNTARYPVWASLARDHLSIMASSVSSERAFSSAGITISKRRNCLKGDIVEALQSLKCAIQEELLFREIPSGTSESEDDDDEAEASAAVALVTEVNAEVLLDDEDAWDALVDDLDDECDALDDEDEDVYVQNIE